MSDASEPPPDVQREHDGLAKLLASYVADHPDADLDAPPAAEAHAAADYLRPYLQELAALEKNLAPFPSNPGAVVWSEVEAAYLDPLNRESITKLGERFGLRRNDLYRWAKARRWKQRRAVLQEIQARRTAASALVPVGGAPPANGNGNGAALLAQGYAQDARLIQLIDKFIAVGEKQIANGELQIKSARDLDLLVRLRKFLEGKAEKIEEHRHVITPEELERRATKVARRMRLDKELAGVVEADFEVVDAGEGAEP